MYPYQRPYQASPYPPPAYSGQWVPQQLPPAPAAPPRFWRGGRFYSLAVAIGWPLIVFAVWHDWPHTILPVEVAYAAIFLAVCVTLVVVPTAIFHWVRPDASLKWLAIVAIILTAFVTFGVVLIAFYFVSPSRRL